MTNTDRLDTLVRAWRLTGVVQSQILRAVRDGDPSRAKRLTKRGLRLVAIEHKALARYGPKSRA